MNDKNNVTNNEGLWKAKDVAEFLKCSASWVYHKTEAGEIPCVKIGAMTRFIPEEIKNWLNSLRLVPVC